MILYGSQFCWCILMEQENNNGIKSEKELATEMLEKLRKMLGSSDQNEAEPAVDVGVDDDVSKREALTANDTPKNVDAPKKKNKSFVKKDFLGK